MEKRALQKKVSLGAPLRDLAAKWEAAIKRHDEDGDYEAALIAFEQLPCSGANISFNMGTVQLSARRWEDAIENYTDALRKDKHCAIAFFQRALAHHKNGSDEDALKDLTECLHHLRRNPYIDYRNLGLAQQLWEFQVQANLAVIYQLLGLKKHAREFLTKAVRGQTGAKMSEFASLNQIQDDLPDLSDIDTLVCDHTCTEGKCALLQLDPAPLFQPRGLGSLSLRPSRRKRKNFLGKSQAKAEGNPLYIRRNSKDTPPVAITGLIEASLFASKLPVLLRRNSAPL